MKIDAKGMMAQVRKELKAAVSVRRVVGKSSRSAVANNKFGRAQASGARQVLRFLAQQ